MTTDQPDPGQWDCDAYGPGGRAFGALCFIAREIGERKCPSLAVCTETMTAERQRVWQRIQDRAAAGDEFFADLAATFPTPDALLGGLGGRSRGPVDPRCSTCGAPVGIFQDHGNGWHHWRGEGTAESPVELYDAGHEVQVTIQG